MTKLQAKGHLPEHVCPLLASLIPLQQASQALQALPPAVYLQVLQKAGT